MLMQQTLLILLLGVFSQAVSLHSERQPIILVKLPGSGKALLRCEDRLGPGTTAIFTTRTNRKTSVRIERRLNSDDYEGLFTNPAMADEVPTGATSVDYLPLLAFPEQGRYDANFWDRLQNAYPKPGEEPFALSELSADGKEAELQLDRYIRLMLSCFKGQHLALLEIGPGGKQVKVWYPNTSCLPPVAAPMGARPLTFRAVYAEEVLDNDGNIVDEAFICTGMATDERGRFVFVALLSDEPRPLSDWLPDTKSTTVFVGINNERLETHQIGPGYYDPKAPKPSFDCTADHLHGATWSVAKCAITVK